MESFVTALLWAEMGFGGDAGAERSGGEVGVDLRRGRSCRRGGDVERPVKGSEDVLILAPLMARRRIKASRSGSFCGGSARELMGPSGVQGQGMATFSDSKVMEETGGVTHSVVVAAAAEVCPVGAVFWRKAGCTFVSLGVIGLGAGLGPNSFWSSSVGLLGRSVGWVVSSLMPGV